MGMDLAAFRQRVLFIIMRIMEVVALFDKKLLKNIMLFKKGAVIMKLNLVELMITLRKDNHIYTNPNLER